MDIVKEFDLAIRFIVRPEEKVIDDDEDDSELEDTEEYGSVEKSSESRNPIVYHQLNESIYNSCTHSF